MKKVRCIIICIVVLKASVPHAMAQAPSAQAAGGSAFTDFYVLSGVVAGANQAGTVEDFRKLAPESNLLQNDLSRFSTSLGDYYSGYGMFAVLAGINFKDRSKGTYRNNPQLRVGFSYYAGTVLRNDLYKETRTPWDTLSSSQTGQYYYMDSLVAESYQMEYKTDQVFIEGSLIYRTNPQARWSLYGGPGLSTGFSINAETTIDYARHAGVSPDESHQNYYGYPVYYASEGTYLSELSRNKNHFALAVFFPLGVDFRIARKSTFWSKVHLFYEMRPSLFFNFVPELRTVSDGAFQSTFGVRVEMK